MACFVDLFKDHVGLGFEIDVCLSCFSFPLFRGWGRGRGERRAREGEEIGGGRGGRVMNEERGVWIGGCGGR